MHKGRVIALFNENDGLSTVKNLLTSHQISSILVPFFYEQSHNRCDRFSASVLVIFAASPRHLEVSQLNLPRTIIVIAFPLLLWQSARLPDNSSGQLNLPRTTIVIAFSLLSWQSARLPDDTLGQFLPRTIILIAFQVFFGNLRGFLTTLQVI